MIEELELLYSEKEILDASNGEITNSDGYLFCPLRETDDGIFSKRIFGNDNYISRRPYQIGHIYLEIPFVFPFFYDEIKIALDLTSQQLNGLLNMEYGVVIDCGHSNNVYYKEILDKKRIAFLNYLIVPGDIKILTGSLAIAFLLREYDKNLNELIVNLEKKYMNSSAIDQQSLLQQINLAKICLERKIKLEKVVSSVIPVMPAIWRPSIVVSENDLFEEINNTYTNIIRLNNDVKRLYSRARGLSTNINMSDFVLHSDILKIQKLVNKLLDIKEMHDYFYSDSSNHQRVGYNKCFDEEIDHLNDGFVTYKGTLLKYIGRTADVIMPDYVTEIRTGAFAKCCVLESIEFHSGIKKIGAFAFADCFLLKKVYIPKEVNKIEFAVFGNTSATIFIEEKEKPTNWDDKWTGPNNNIVWGYVMKNE